MEESSLDAAKTMYNAINLAIRGKSNKILLTKVGSRP